MIDIDGENGVGWPLVRAIDVGDCSHCLGVVWERIDKAFMCLRCGCLADPRGRESHCRDRRPA